MYSLSETPMVNISVKFYESVIHIFQRCDHNLPLPRRFFSTYSCGYNPGLTFCRITLQAMISPASWLVRLAVAEWTIMNIRSCGIATHTECQPRQLLNARKSRES